MTTRKAISEKYKPLYAALHNEFFETVNKDTHLKPDKLAEDFNSRYHELEQEHEAELLAAGILPPEDPPPPRNLPAEIDDLKEWAKTKGYVEKK